MGNQDQLQFLQQGLNFVDGTSWTSHHYWWTSAADQDDEGSWIWSNSKKNVLTSSGQRMSRTIVQTIRLEFVLVMRTAEHWSVMVEQLQTITSRILTVIYPLFTTIMHPV